jgi:hypothetical protein
MNKTLEKITKKYEDWWGRHNLTSRLSIFTFLILYVASVFIILFNPINATLAQVILNTTGYIALVTILAVIFGPNTIVKLADVISDKKYSRYINKFNDNFDDEDDEKIERNLKTPKTPKDY